MAFQIKNFVSIVGGAINRMRGTQSELTDFNVGSVARTMIEAPAIEMDELYQQMVNGLLESIPVATFNSFDFGRLAAVPASGLVRVTITAAAADVLIPAGTAFSSPLVGTTYVAAQDVTIETGDTFADVLVTAQTAGLVGNTVANTAMTLNPTPTNFVSASNTAAFINGAEEETDDQRKRRFNEFIATLSRATNAALVYGAKTVILYDAAGAESERVRTALAYEPYLDTDDIDDLAQVTVYIHNGAGDTSSDLVDLTAEVLHGYTDPDTGVKVPGFKAAGVKVTVEIASEVSVNVASGQVWAEPGYDIDTLLLEASATFADYVWGIEIGESYLEAEAVARIMAIPGVLNITGLPADTDSDFNEKLIPNTLNFTDGSV